MSSGRTGPLRPVVRHSTMWEKSQHGLSQVCLLRGHKAAASDTVCLHTFTATNTDTEE